MKYILGIVKKIHYFSIQFHAKIMNFFLLHLIYIYVLRVQISSVRFPKDGSSCCEWFIVTADFSGFREVKHLLIIFSLYRFEFHTLIFTVFEMSNFVLTKHLREI